MATTLSGCLSLNNRIDDIGRLNGKTQAGVVLPDWPTECRKKDIHAALKKGEEIRSILKRERAALNRANKRTEICAKYYDELRLLMGGDK